MCDGMGYLGVTGGWFKTYGMFQMNGGGCGNGGESCMGIETWRRRCSTRWRYWVREGQQVLKGEAETTIVWEGQQGFWAKNYRGSRLGSVLRSWINLRGLWGENGSGNLLHGSVSAERGNHRNCDGNVAVLLINNALWTYRHRIFVISLPRFAYTEFRCFRCNMSTSASKSHHQPFQLDYPASFRLLYQYPIAKNSLRLNSSVCNSTTNSKSIPPDQSTDFLCLAVAVNLLPKQYPQTDQYWPTFSTPRFLRTVVFAHQ